MSQTEKNLHILEAVRSGKISPADALAQLNADSPGQTGFADLGFARIDLDRKRRCGHAEVIFGQGKTPEWIIGGARRLHESQQSCLVTRVPEEAVAKVRQRYFENFRDKDLHLFLGTTREWHGRGKNPFVVIGAFYPPIQNQPELF